MTDIATEEPVRCACGDEIVPKPKCANCTAADSAPPQADFDALADAQRLELLSPQIEESHGSDWANVLRRVGAYLRTVAAFNVGRRTRPFIIGDDERRKLLASVNPEGIAPLSDERFGMIVDTVEEIADGWARGRQVSDYMRENEIEKNVKLFANELRAELDSMLSKVEVLRQAGASIDVDVHVGQIARLDSIHRRLHQIVSDADARRAARASQLSDEDHAVLLRVVRMAANHVDPLSDIPKAEAIIEKLVAVSPRVRKP